MLDNLLVLISNSLMFLMVLTSSFDCDKNLFFTGLNFTSWIIINKSDSKLDNSLVDGGHLLDLNPWLFLAWLSIFPKNWSVFHLILFARFSTVDIGRTVFHCYCTVFPLGSEYFFIDNWYWISPHWTVQLINYSS